MNVQTSNRLTDLSARIRQAQDRAKVASVEAAEQYLEAGRLLIEAKAECRHGDWLPFLEMSGMHKRQARRLMQIARSGLEADTVSDLGGVKAALEHLAEKKPSETEDDGWRWAEGLRAAARRHWRGRRCLRDTALAHTGPGIIAGPSGTCRNTGHARARYFSSVSTSRHGFPFR